MESAAVLETPDQLSKDLVAAARFGTSIFVIPKTVSRMRFGEFYRRNAANLRHFNDEKHLGDESKRLREIAGTTMHQRARDAVGKLFSSISIGPAEFPIELTLATNQGRFGIRDDSIGQIVRIDENQLTAGTLAKFLDAYSPLPSEQRPVFIIEAHDQDSSIELRLSQAPEDMAIQRFGDHGRLRELVVERLPSQSLAQLIDQYAENSFSPVARVDLPLLEDSMLQGQPTARDLAARLVHLRAVASERGKFETMPAAKSLAELLEHRTDLLSTEEAPILLATKAFTNLWRLYCSEESKSLFDNSMAIAQHLQNDLIRAHCIRLINTVHAHGSFTDQCSRQAAAIFFDHEMFDFANYCLNNALVGRFYTLESSTRAFAEMIDDSATNLQGFRGLAILMNNAGVAHLIEGKALDALAWFERAAEQPTLPLHRFGIHVNAMIARYLEGEDPSADDLLRCAKAIVRQVDSRYRHHIAHLFLNLYSLARGDAGCAAALLEMLKGLDVLNTPVIRNDRTTLARVAVRLGLINAPTEEHPGLRGRFIEQHLLVPGFHHTWL